MKALERKKKRVFGRALLLAGMIVALVAAIHTHSMASQTLSADGVEAIQVCMVNDQVMGRPQIPVEYDGKTYYGCCQGCVHRIKTDRSIRYSTDPVTGAEVDKAMSYIVEAPGGEALYFESAETARRYTAPGAGNGGSVR